ncbi:MAG: hypothetical protein A2Y10_12460 [Planctomycetes bacterium GWF2_41_51]|nr:MAG: hypothetical protein A2Y10_12460 [Planctomycetes bacterium GWF2_41_51]HBG27234.1 hypothetical protein [Phycisphaerales bacterium]
MNLFRKLIYGRTAAKLFERTVLNLHSKLYTVASIYSKRNNGGRHPKHDIINYTKWFCDHIEVGWVVLDIGSHFGSMVQGMATKADFVYGIEINKHNYSQAMKENSKKNVKYIHDDAMNFDYSKLPGIDCVTLSNVLEHISDRIVFLKTLVNNVKWSDRGLKQFLIRVPAIERDWISVYKKQKGVKWKLDNSHDTEYTLEQFYDEMNKANLRVIDCRLRFGEIYSICAVK